MRKAGAPLSETTGGGRGGHVRVILRDQRCVVNLTDDATALQADESE
jgi:hypothetical protein